MAKILIVDDAIFMRQSLKRALEAHGYTVCGEAGDGREAIAKFAELKPDVTILDITMPEMSGIEALKHIKAINPDVCTFLRPIRILLMNIYYIYITEAPHSQWTK